MWVVTSTTRSEPVASIIATSTSPARWPKNSVSPGYSKPARWSARFSTGPVTIASTSPASASLTASSTARPAIRPASAASERPTPRSLLPIKVRSASSGPRRTALSITSGPMPRGSPSVTAKRGRRMRLVSDVDVRHATEQVEIMLDRELLAEGVLDAVLHLVKRELTLGQALGQLEHDEARPGGPLADLEHGLQARHGVVPDDLDIVGRQLRHGERVRQFRLVRVRVAARQRIELGAVRQRVVHGVGLALRDRDLRGRDVRLDEDMAGENLRRLRPLHLDDVEPEFGPDHVRDDAGLEPERHIFELLDHHPAEI